VSVDSLKKYSTVQVCHMNLMKIFRSIKAAYTNET